MNDRRRQRSQPDERSEPHGPEAGRARPIRWRDMTWGDYVRVGLGLAFAILGVIGLVLPILQGILFLIVAAMLLAPYSRWVQKQLHRGEQRFPWLTSKARAMTRRWSKKNNPEK